MSKEIRELLDTVAVMQGTQAHHGECLDSITRGLHATADSFELTRERDDMHSKRLDALERQVDKMIELTSALGLNLALLGDRLNALEHNQQASNPEMFFGETQGNA